MATAVSMPVAPSLPGAPAARVTRLVVATYNIRSCLTGGGSFDRVAEVLAGAGADVVALQEVDLARGRSRGVDQAAELADHLGLEPFFQTALSLDGGHYGIAVLAPHGSARVRGGPLPSDREGIEPRVALWLRLPTSPPLQLLATHLALARRDRRLQVAELLGERWLGHPSCLSPVVLCGDLNLLPGSGGHRRLTRRLADVARVAGAARATFPSHLPLVRLDYVLASRDLAVRRATVLREPAIRRASDHLPLVVDLELPPAEQGEPRERAPIGG